MRLTWVLAVGAGIAVSIATGCGNAESASGPATSASGAAPDCVVGTWRATSVEASAGSGDTSARLSGGAGAELTVGDHGEARVDFDAMQPVAFSAAVAGAEVRGEYRYHGSLDGTVAFPGDPGQSGRWRPVGTVDWSALRVTLRFTDPFQATPLEDAPLEDLPGDARTQAGDTVDLQPLLREGDYRCDGDALLVSPEASGPTIDWTFTRV